MMWWRQQLGYCSHLYRKRLYLESLSVDDIQGPVVVSFCKINGSKKFKTRLWPRLQASVVSRPKHKARTVREEEQTP